MNLFGPERVQVGYDGRLACLEWSWATPHREDKHDVIEGSSVDMSLGSHERGLLNGLFYVIKKIKKLKNSQKSVGHLEAAYDALVDYVILDHYKRTSSIFSLITCYENVSSFTSLQLRDSGYDLHGLEERNHYDKNVLMMLSASMLMFYCSELDRLNIRYAEFHIDRHGNSSWPRPMIDVFIPVSPHGDRFLDLKDMMTSSVNDGLLISMLCDRAISNAFGVKPGPLNRESLVKALQVDANVRNLVIYGSRQHRSSYRKRQDGSDITARASIMLLCALAVRMQAFEARENLQRLISRLIMYAGRRSVKKT